SFPCALPSFPTRRSSDLVGGPHPKAIARGVDDGAVVRVGRPRGRPLRRLLRAHILLTRTREGDLRGAILLARAIEGDDVSLYDVPGAAHVELDVFARLPRELAAQLEAGVMLHLRQ